MTKRIALSQGMFALVDDEDFDRLNCYNWYIKKSKFTCYVERYETLMPTEYQNVSMHREIMSVEDGYDIDHINHNGLDNRKVNLRVCTRAQNLRNKRRYSNNKSGYKGVYWDKYKNGYMAQIRINGRKIVLGRFECPLDAAKAYDKAALKYHKEFAKTNF